MKGWFSLRSNADARTPFVFALQKRGSYPQSQSRRKLVKRPVFFLAGMKGFEPLNHGTKTRCLTTWLHPNTVTKQLYQ